MTNKTKQTAVEWLVEHLTEYGFDLSHHKIEIKQAKEIEKEQHKKIRNDALSEVENKLELLKLTYGGNK